jgi:hypothetical protein
VREGRSRLRPFDKAIFVHLVHQLFGLSLLDHWIRRQAQWELTLLRLITNELVEYYWLLSTEFEYNRKSMWKYLITCSGLWDYPRKSQTTVCSARELACFFMAPNRDYVCICDKCNGHKVVGKTTFYKHAKQRHKVFVTLQDFRLGLQNSNPSALSGIWHTRQRPGKRQKNRNFDQLEGYGRGSASTSSGPYAMVRFVDVMLWLK